MKAIYVRQSVDRKDSISIESQIEFCKRAIDPEDEFEVYEDRGYSGKNTQRPKFQKMLADIRAGAVTHVVVYKIDRISRSLLDFSGIIETFQSCKVEFVSATEKFDTSSPMGMAMLSIIMVFAELERKTIQQRITDNYYQRGKNGTWLGGPAPYGFKNSAKARGGGQLKTLEAIPAETAVVRRVYAEYSETGISLGKLAKKLNEEGVPAKRGGTWSGDMIGKMLRNPVHVRADADVYVFFSKRGCQMTNPVSEFDGSRSCLLYGKRPGNERKYTDVKGHCLSLFALEGTVDSHTWLACQKKLDENRQIGNRGQGRHTWLSGLVKCKKCGYALVCVQSDGVLYFHCSNKRNKGACPGQGKTQYVKEIEAAVEGTMLRRAAQLKDFPGAEKPAASFEANRIKQELVEIEEGISSLVDSLRYIKGAGAAIVGERINELDQRRAAAIERLGEEGEKTSPQADREDIYEAVQNWGGLDIESKKTFAGILISGIYIDENVIKIDWKAMEDE